MKYNNDSTNAFLIHISAFAGFIFPFGNIITPLIAWQTLKDRSEFLDHQGKEAINFNISYTLYVCILAATFVPFAITSFFSNWNDFGNINININNFNLFGFVGLASLAGLVALLTVGLTIIASLKAKEGILYKYPFTIKFIK